MPHTSRASCHVLLCRERSRHIAEQLARLQDESRLLQEHSRKLQERAVVMQMQVCGVGMCDMCVACVLHACVWHA